jgi:hypothetical protein
LQNSRLFLIYKTKKDKSYLTCTSIRAAVGLNLKNFASSHDSVSFLMKKLLVQFILKAKFETYLTCTSIRAAVGLNLKNSIVIVDEAHNLLETITNIHRLPSSSFAKKPISKQCCRSGSVWSVPYAFGPP